MTKCTVRRYEQLDTSPETIDLQFANTDRFKENYSIGTRSSRRQQCIIISRRPSIACEPASRRGSLDFERYI